MPIVYRETAIPPAAPASNRERLAWIDTARGLTMLLVVLLHVDQLSQAVGEPEILLILINYMLFPLRMPLFFLVAGLLAAGLLRRSAGEVLRRRVLHYAWLYALWFALNVGIHAWVLRGVGAPEIHEHYTEIADPVQAALSASNSVWFLYALMLYFTLALMLRRLPALAQGAVALGLALFGMFEWGEAIGLPLLDRLYHFPYFLIGVLAADRLRPVVPRLARPVILLPLGLLWLVLAALAHRERILQDPAVIAALSLIAVPTGLAAAAWATERYPALVAPLQLVGRNTLVVYVLHTICLRLLMALVPQPEWLPGLVILPALAVLAVALALAAGSLLERVPGLLGLPSLPGARMPLSGAHR